MARLAILASGSGSNFQALAEFLKDGGNHQIACLVCDKAGAYALERAAKLGIPSRLVSYKGRPKEDAEAEIEDYLREQGAECIALAGFMRMLSARFVSAWAGRLVNIHPSLLPKHPGAHAIEASFRSHDGELGITIHYVDEGMDSGKIILQKSFSRESTMTLEEAERKIHELEHLWYPQVVSDLLSNF